MRRWPYKADDAGKPRRFLGHGEAVSWALLKVGKVIGGIAALMLLNATIAAYADWGTWVYTFVPALAGFWLAVWPCLSLALPLYVALFGGVMDEEARRRYHNNETLSRSR